MIGIAVIIALILEPVFWLTIIAIMIIGAVVFVFRQEYNEEKQEKNQEVQRLLEAEREERWERRRIEAAVKKGKS